MDDIRKLIDLLRTEAAAADQLAENHRMEYSMEAASDLADTARIAAKALESFVDSAERESHTVQKS